MAQVETFYKVRRGGYTRPVGTLLTTTEFEAIRNRKQLLEAGYLVPVRLPINSKKGSK